SLASATLRLGTMSSGCADIGSTSSSIWLVAAMPVTGLHTLSFRRPQISLTVALRLARGRRCFASTECRKAPQKPSQVHVKDQRPRAAFPGAQCATADGDIQERTT